MLRIAVHHTTDVLLDYNSKNHVITTEIIIFNPTFKLSIQITRSRIVRLERNSILTISSKNEGT